MHLNFQSCNELMQKLMKQLYSFYLWAITRGTQGGSHPPRYLATAEHADYLSYFSLGDGSINP